MVTGSDERGQVRELAERAATLAEGRRSEWLDDSCGVDTELRAEVDAFLAAMPRGAADWSGMPEQVGPYRLLECLGEGGFGAVYLAEQRAPVQRRVAVKLLKPGMDSRQVLARFEAEQQALALMDHPGIARVLEAGVSDQGRPWFAMELIRGEPLTTWARRAAPPLEARLELMATLCDAIQHAHSKGVIHRDIKPGNVLVRDDGDGPVATVIDFGIAKAMHQPLTDRTLFTAQRSLMGTPGYMAPEQAAQRSVDVDTRTDVYGLGALLYVLLTGSPAFDGRELSSLGLAELIRHICDVEPERPSQRLGREVPDGHPFDAEVLRGDLDDITSKCLAKEPEQRYATAAALGDDLRRVLAHEPVQATTPSLAYRLRKAYRRNRVAVISLACLVAVLVLAVVVLSTTTIIALDLRDEADAAARTARRRADELELVAAFQADRFRKVDPEAMAVTLRAAMLANFRAGEQRRARDPQDIERRHDELVELLDSVNATEVVLGLLDEDLFRDTDDVLRERFADQPAVRGRLMQSLATTLREIGLTNRARAPQVEALTTLEAEFGPASERALASRAELGELLVALEDWDAAATCYERALALHAERGDDDLAASAALLGLGRVALQRGELVQARQRLDDVLALRSGQLGAGHLQTLEVQSLRALLALREGRLRDADALHVAILPALARQLGERHPEVIRSRLNHADTLLELRENERAEALARGAWEACQETLGARHQLTVRATLALSQVLVYMHRYDEARRLLEETVPWLEARHGARHPSTLMGQLWIGVAHLDRIELLQAAPLLEAAERGLSEVLEPGDERLGEARIFLGMCRLAQGRSEEARRVFTQARRDLRRSIGGLHPTTLEAQRYLFKLMHGDGESLAAASLAYELLVLVPGLFGKDLPAVGQLQRDAEALLGAVVALPAAGPEALAEKLLAAAALQVGLGQHDDAVTLLGDGVLPMLAEHLEGDALLGARARSLLGEALLGRGEHAEAGELLRDAYAVLEGLGPQRVGVLELAFAAHRVLAWLRVTGADPAELATWEAHHRRWDTLRE